MLAQLTDSKGAPKRRLVIVIPAYNESSRIVETIVSLRDVGDRLSLLGFTQLIYVVNDGSSDDTAELAERAGADRILRHGRNLGLGAAVRTGLQAARLDAADIVVKFDADLQHDPQDIPGLVEPIIDDEADIVYGDRFERIEYRMPIVRKIGNITFTRLMGWLTGWPLRDSQPGMFAVDRGYLEVFKLPGDYNYTQQLLLDAYHKGMRFAHVPISFRQRKTGTSFISMKYPFRVLPQILMVLVSLKPLRVFAPLGLIFLAIGFGVFTFQFAQWLTGEASRPVESVNLVLGSSLFGLQILFFGILAQLVVDANK